MSSIIVTGGTVGHEPISADNVHLLLVGSVKKGDKITLNGEEVVVTFKDSWDSLSSGGSITLCNVSASIPFSFFTE